MQRNIVGGAFFSAMRTQGQIGREKMIVRKKKCGRETLYSLQRDTCNFLLFPLMQLSWLQNHSVILFLLYQ